jgi:hypothetical protein
LIEGVPCPCGVDRTAPRRFGALGLLAKVYAVFAYVTVLFGVVKLVLDVSAAGDLPKSAGPWPLLLAVVTDVGGTALAFVFLLGLSQAIKLLFQIAEAVKA